MIYNTWKERDNGKTDIFFFLNDKKLDEVFTHFI